MRDAPIQVALVIGLTLSTLLAGCLEPAPLEPTRIEPPPPREPAGDEEPVQRQSVPPPARRNDTTAPPPASAPPPAPPGPPPLPGPFTLANDLQGCQEVVFAAPVDLAAAQALLPANYTAAEFARLVTALGGQPTSIPLGKGVVLLASLACEAGTEGPHSFADLMVYVEPPNVTGERDPVTLDFYNLGLYSPSARLAAALGPLGFPILPATTSALVAPPDPAQPLPGTPLQGALSDAADAEGPFAHVEGAASGGVPAARSVRIWWAHAAGTVLGEFQVADTPNYLGAPIACSFREGSAAAAAFGFTSCGPAGDALLFATPGEDMTGTYSWMPGAFAQA